MAENTAANQPYLRPSAIMLDSIRAGQPVSELFTMFASGWPDIVEWMDTRIRNESRFFRMVEGPFGFGKTTLAKTMIARQEALGIFPIISILPGNHGSFKERTVVSRWLFDGALDAMLEMLRQHPPEADDWLRSTASPEWMPLSMAVYVLAHGLANEREMKTLLTRWILENRIQGLKNALASIFDGVQVPVLQNSIIESYCNIMARMVHYVHRFPVFIVDEAESILLLNNGSAGKDGAIQRFREILDEASQPVTPAYGVIFLITTEGLDLLQRYGALWDRLTSPDGFFMPEHPVWRMQLLSRWERPEAVLDWLVDCYSVEDGSARYRRIEEKLKVMRPEVREIALEWLSRQDTSPRERLRNVVCDILDRHVNMDSVDAWLLEQQRPKKDLSEPTIPHLPVPPRPGAPSKFDALFGVDEDLDLSNPPVPLRSDANPFKLDDLFDVDEEVEELDGAADEVCTEFSSACPDVQQQIGSTIKPTGALPAKEDVYNGYALDRSLPLLEQPLCMVYHENPHDVQGTCFLCSAEPCPFPSTIETGALTDCGEHPSACAGERDYEVTVTETQSRTSCDPIPCEHTITEEYSNIDEWLLKSYPQFLRPNTPDINVEEKGNRLLTISSTCFTKKGEEPVHPGGCRANTSSHVFGAWFGRVIGYETPKKILQQPEGGANLVSNSTAMTFLENLMHAWKDGMTFPCKNLSATLPPFPAKQVPSHLKSALEKAHIHVCPLPDRFSDMRCVAWNILWQIAELQEFRGMPNRDGMRLLATVDHMIADIWGVQPDLHLAPRTGIFFYSKTSLFSLSSPKKRVEDMPISSASSIDISDIDKLQPEEENFPGTSRLTAIDAKLEQKKEQLAKLKAKKNVLLNRARSAEEKARTRTLIQIGAILEKHLGISSVEETEAYIKTITHAPAVPPPAFTHGEGWHNQWCDVSLEKDD